MRAVCFLLLFAVPAMGQNFEAAVKKRLNEQFNDRFDKAEFNKKFGPSIKMLEFGKPFDSDDCEIDSTARTVRDTKHPEVWALMQRDAKRAGIAETATGADIRDRYPAEWSPVEIKGKAVRVKYERIRGGNDQFAEYNNRRKYGQSNPIEDKTFLLDNKGVIFAEFDSQHLRRAEQSPNDRSGSQHAPPQERRPGP